MKYKPHSYQEYAIRYIETHPISALLIDMGLGKTSITLTAIRNLLFDSFEVCKVLVIAPLRVAKNTWTDEIKKWEHLSTLTYSLIVGNENERLSALNEVVSRCCACSACWSSSELRLGTKYNLAIICRGAAIILNSGTPGNSLLRAAE